MACLAASQATGSHLRRREGLRDPSAPAKRSGPEERRSLLPTLPSAPEAARGCRHPTDTREPTSRGASQQSYWA